MFNLSQKIADEFGSKRGFLRYLVFGIKSSLGRYHHATKTDLNDVDRLVFICSGNICRSPFGEEVAKVNHFDAVSYGLHCRGGDPAFERTLLFSKELGYDLSSHRSQHISSYAPKPTDLLVVMEPAHLLELEQQFPESKKVLIGVLSSQRTVYLHDPYNTNDYFFIKCLRSIEMATKKLLTHVGKTK